MQLNIPSEVKQKWEVVTEPVLYKLCWKICTFTYVILYKSSGFKYI